jgi:DNA-directed RNA polymerase specialized sigma24 family protein
VSPDDILVLVEKPAQLLVALDEALKRLEQTAPRQSRVVECRFFGRMTIKDTADALGVSRNTIKRDWNHAQIWLYRELKRTQPGLEEVESSG